MARRDNGTGTVYQRPNGSWVGRIYMGRGADGKPKYPDRKTVSVRNMKTGEVFEECYDKLLLSPGAKPTQPRLPGVELNKLFTLRTVEDTFSVDTVILSPMSHAGYYPGGKVMTMKVVFEKESYRLLGAQIVGYEGVDKRIDVLATAIHAGMKATQLKDLDLAYAPPYSSAKDPVNMAGFMVENIANGILKQWHLEDASGLPRDGSVTLLDTRTVKEYARGHVDGFVNIPVDELRERLGELDKSKPVYVICQSGLRSYIACRILAGNGYNCYNFSGGFRFYDAVMHDRCLIQSATACGMDQ